MDWLRDIAEKREQQQRTEEQDRQAYAALLASELRKTTPFVERLLRDVGALWYGTHWLPWLQKFQIEKPNPNRWTLFQNQNRSRSLHVVLYPKSIHHSTPHFIITANGGDIVTQDTSEAELRPATRARPGVRAPLRQFAFG